jgi:hypothetical protein
VDTKNIERYLKSFGNQVVNNSKKLLTAKKGSTDLSKSISFRVVKTKQGFTVQFSMMDYGAYVDKGVSGNKKIQEYTTYDNRKIESPFKYRNKQPPTGIIEKWIKRKGLKGRVDKKWKGAGNRGGQFITNKSFAFLIARSIKVKGLKSLSFFQKPLGLGLKQFGIQMLDSLSNDIIENLSKTTITTK